MKRYDILSPDGFSIEAGKTYTKPQIPKAFNQWKKKYETQGYYSSNEGRIPLEDLADVCEIVEIKH